MINPDRESNAPFPKQPKIKDPLLKANYRNAHTICERCHGFFERLELHHIRGGNKRSDELWNIIMLCRKCHHLCTEHIFGKSARKTNDELLLYKLKKGEVTKAKLRELGVII